MSNDPGRPKSLLDLLREFLGGPAAVAPPSPATPAPVPAGPLNAAGNIPEPARVATARVLLLIYDPVVDPKGGKKLSQFMKWGQPDLLVNAFIQDIAEVSGGMARYQIVQRVERNEFPPKLDGFRYDAAGYLAALSGEQETHKPKGADYVSILNSLNLLPAINRRGIDEVWIFAFPHAGFYESIMTGPGAFWCNAPPLTWTPACSRRFTIMGFNFERGVGEMLEAFGHRSESILTRLYEKKQGEENLYARFSRYEKSHPGQAAVGNIHFAPNSERDYDWNNPRSVPSDCYDWYNFPTFKNDIRPVDAREWGSGDIRLHHKWWLKHLPHVAGRTDGIANNWWQYVLFPEQVNL
jgi:hypothetical protein